MPHLTLEYSDNVQAEQEWPELFLALHCILADVGGIRLENCKSRAYAAHNYLIGAGDNNAGFVHLDIRFVEGRSPEAIDSMGQELLKHLLSWFDVSQKSLDLQITVEIQDIQLARYFKYPAGTLTPQ